MAEVIPLESTITARILRRLNVEPGVYAIKVKADSSMARGTPDILGSRHGRMFAFEVKRPKKGSVSESQRFQLQRWANAGCIAAVVESVDDVLEVLGL